MPESRRPCERRWLAATAKSETPDRYPSVAMTEDPVSDPSDATSGEPNSGMVASESDHPVTPFSDLVVPDAVSAEPPERARWLAFGGILVGGLLGGLIGYGTGDLLGESALWAAVGGLIGGVAGAVGVGIVASLTLRAMNEWQPIEHPEQR